MNAIESHQRNYLLAVTLGAIGGGVFVAVVTRAVPKMMSGMMRNMMSEMGKAGCDPEEM